MEEIALHNIRQSEGLIDSLLQLKHKISLKIAIYTPRGFSNLGSEPGTPGSESERKSLIHLSS